MSTQIAAEPLRRGSIFSYGGRTYQVRRIDPGWGEHGQLVADSWPTTSASWGFPSRASSIWTPSRSAPAI